MGPPGTYWAPKWRQNLIFRLKNWTKSIRCTHFFMFLEPPGVPEATPSIPDLISTDFRWISAPFRTDFSSFSNDFLASAAGVCQFLAFNHHASTAGFPSLPRYIFRILRMPLSLVSTVFLAFNHVLPTRLPKVSAVAPRYNI